MSPSDRGAELADLASTIAARLAEAIEDGRLDDIPDDSLGQIFAAVVRTFAAKAEKRGAPPPFGHNSGITATEVMIGCTAMLEGVGLQVFELGLWQSWSGLGRIRPPASDQLITDQQNV